MLGMLAASCSGEPERSPWEKKPRDLPCGFEPRSCLGSDGDMLVGLELTGATSAVDRRPLPDDYAGHSGCELGYVLDLPAANLSGDAMQLKALWNEFAGTTRGLERCDDYAATHRVYTPDAAEPEGYRLVDHRTFSARANAQSQLCDPVIESAGPGEPDMPQNEPIWLTPTLYPDGLRVVVAALEGCEPLPLSLRISENFPSAGDPVDPGESQ